jgi:hypothetical protein
VVESASSQASPESCARSTGATCRREQASSDPKTGASTAAMPSLDGEHLRIGLEPRIYPSAVSQVKAYYTDGPRHLSANHTLENFGSL